MKKIILIPDIMFRTVLAFAILSCAIASPAVEWSLHSSHHDVKTSLAGIPYTVKTDTYYSQPIALKAGHMVVSSHPEPPLLLRVLLLAVHRARAHSIGHAQRHLRCNLLLW